MDFKYVILNSSIQLFLKDSFVYLETSIDDIEIIFSKDDWEAKAEFAQTDVHRQIAIVFKSPPFREQNITEEVEVSVCLRRMSDRMDSEPVKFTYVPDNAGELSDAI